MWGVMSTLTPTSMYWNCVVLRPVRETPLTADELVPVAIGTRSPILIDAFCPSTDRICGFWMIFVLLSVNKAVALALEIVAVKSVAFRLARSEARRVGKEG